jgi:hypothetical protein
MGILDASDFLAIGISLYLIMMFTIVYEFSITKVFKHYKFIFVFVPVLPLVMLLVLITYTFIFVFSGKVQMAWNWLRHPVTAYSVILMLIEEMLLNIAALTEVLADSGQKLYPKDLIELFHTHQLQNKDNTKEITKTNKDFLDGVSAKKLTTVVFNFSELIVSSFQATMEKKTSKAAGI